METYFLKLLAYRPTMWTFQLALQGYSLASLPWALRLHSRSLAHLGFVLRTRILGRFASILSLKKKKCIPLTHYALLA